jgi:hypothetical protein
MHYRISSAFVSSQLLSTDPTFLCDKVAYLFVSSANVVKMIAHKQNKKSFSLLQTGKEC